MGTWEKSKEERATVWRRLEEFQFDPPAADFTFCQRLARENAWSQGFAARVVEEYKRFVFLCTFEPPATPSFQVDQAWHLHLTFTRNYWEGLCKAVLPRPLHHNPTQGGPKEDAKYWRQYAETLKAYEKHFGRPAPVDIWPPPSVRFARDLKHRWVNPEDYWLVPKPPWLALAWARARQLLQPVSTAMSELAEWAPKVSHSASLSSWGVISMICLWLPLLFGSAAALVEDATQVKNSFMGELSGSEFLVLFSVMSGLSFLPACCLFRPLQHCMSCLGDARDLQDTKVDLHPHEVALLANGQDGCLRSSVLGLVRKEALAVVQEGRSKGLCARYQNLKGWESPLEQALIQACSTPKSLSKLAGDKRVKRSMRDLREDLADKGLLLSIRQSYVWGLLVYLPPIMVLLFLGVPRWLGANGRPVDYLIALMCIVLVFLARMVCQRWSMVITDEGRSVLDLYQQSHGHLRRNVNASSTPEDAMVAFALFGVGALAADSGLRSQVQPLLADGGGGSNGGTGCGGGGCGGGGCGGGGCGGCGG